MLAKEELLFFPVLSKWIDQFLAASVGMIAHEREANKVSDDGAMAQLTFCFISSSAPFSICCAC